MIDRLREQIQERLDQLTGEADRLRKALAALDPRSPNPPARERPARTRTAATKPGSASKPARAPRSSTRPTRSPRRTAPGVTKAAVLAALADGEAMTAGEVAARAGLAPGTVSTTLSKLAKTGEVQKAERGYRLGTAAPATPSSPAQ